MSEKASRTDWTAFGVLAVGAAAHYVLTTGAVDVFPRQWLVLSSLLGVVLAGAAAFGLPRRGDLASLTRREMALGATSGLWLLASQRLVASNRMSDAPTGADTLFLTTVCWGLLVVGIAAVMRKATLSQVLAASLGVIAGGVVVADWERPSSFSPFVRWVPQEVALLLAGFAWAAFVFSLAAMVRRRGLRTAFPVVSIPAALVALVLALFSDPAALPSALAEWPYAVADAAAFGAVVVSLALLLRSWEPSRTAAPLFLAPALVTLLIIVERYVGVSGPMPLLLVPVLVGAALGVLAAAGVALPAGCDVRPSWHRPDAARLLAAAGALAALAALVLPAVDAEVSGKRFSGAAYHAAWTMPGAETFGPWLALAAASAALWALCCAPDRRRLMAWSLAALAVGAACVLVGPVPVRTWTRWIPSEVQQDYGTEYARLTRSPRPRLPEGIALGATALGLLVSMATGAKSEGAADSASPAAPLEEGSGS